MIGRWAACCFIIALTTLHPASAPAQTGTDDEARSATAACPDVIRGQSQTFDAGLCLGILNGLHYLSRDVCIPPATSLGQVAEVVSKYLDSHAGKPNDDFRETSLEAMRSAWPCGTGRTI